MPIRRKVLLGFITLLCLLAVTGGITILQMSQMGEKATDIKDNWLPSVTMLGEVETQTVYIQRFLNALGMESNESEMTRYENNITDAVKK